MAVVRQYCILLARRPKAAAVIFDFVLIFSYSRTSGRMESCHVWLVEPLLYITKQSYLELPHGSRSMVHRKLTGRFFADRGIFEL